MRRHSLLFPLLVLFVRWNQVMALLIGAVLFFVASAATAHFGVTAPPILAGSAAGVPDVTSTATAESLGAVCAAIELGVQVAPLVVLTRIVAGLGAK